MTELKLDRNRKPGTRRETSSRSGIARSEAERQRKFHSILDAAFEVFSEKGFAATRLDDVARRAGVAKGTLYLYAGSKQQLFEALIRHSFTASFDKLEEAITAADFSVEQLISMLLDYFRKEILATRRREMVWLILREAKQFPEMARTHHELIINRALQILRRCSERALASGEIAHDEVVRFPHLAIAPALLTIIWMELFQDVEQLDVDGLMEAHRALILRGLKGETISI